MSYREVIEAAYQTQQIVRIYCEEQTDDFVEGFVVGRGADFFGLEIFSETIHLNGFNCFRFGDVTGCDMPAPYHNFMLRVMSARDLQRSAITGIDFFSLRSLIETVGRAFPIQTFHFKFDDSSEDFEEDLSDVCYIGEVVNVSATEVKLREITPNAEWEAELTTYPLDLIYRVDFGGGYEEALLLAVQ